MKTFYIYSESELELGPEQVDVQFFTHQHLITNPNATKGSPKLLKQPQHVIALVFFIIENQSEYDGIRKREAKPFSRIEHSTVLRKTDIQLIE